MVPKVTLKTLYKDTFKRSTLIAIPNMSELLEVPGSEFTKWEIFAQICREALYKFEYYYPLGRIQKMLIEVDANSRIGIYHPNFEAYLNNVLDEYDIVLPIASCQGLGYNGYLNSQYPLRDFRFENGKFYDMWYSTNIYWGNCLCKRPLIEDYNREHQGDPTDKCAIYFLEKDLDNQYSIFRDQLYVEVCHYLLNIKKNFGLPNMPIDLFQGLEDDMNKVESNLQSIYEQSQKSSFWLI